MRGDLEPHDLAAGRGAGHAPSGGQRVDDEPPAAGLACVLDVTSTAKSPSSTADDWSWSSRSHPSCCRPTASACRPAATLLVTVGDNPERLKSDATLARLCGVAPIPTGSGKTDGYHRLHRGGDRQAISALWTIVLSRMATDPATRTYVDRRRKEGKQTRFIVRCLKRHVSREIYKLLPRPELLLTT